MLSNEVPSMFVWGRLLIAGIQQALEEASKRSEKKSHVPLAFMTPTPPLGRSLVSTCPIFSPENKVQVDYVCLPER